MSTAEPSRELCVTHDFGGISHPYSKCIKKVNEMVDQNKIQGSGSLNMNAMTEYAGAFINYATSLINNPENIIKQDCSGILGNKYVFKSKVKCADGVNNVHKYIDNVSNYNVFTSQYESNMGILPSALGSATRINATGLLYSLTGDTNPECVSVKLPCHLIKSDMSQQYSGESNPVHISKDDYDKLTADGVDVTRVEQSDTAGFTNLSESINNYLYNNNDLIYNNKIYTSNSHNNSNNSENSENNNTDDTLNNIYYLAIAILLSFVLYKLIHKK